MSNPTTESGFRWPENRRRVWVVLVLLVLALTAGISFRYRESAARWFRSYRVAKFMRQAETAYRAGETRLGSLAVGSALEIDPTNLEAKLLRANWLLRLGSKEEGINAWRSILIENEPALPRALPLSYASQLINNGAFEELFLLSVRQLSRERTLDQGVWVNLAGESARLRATAPSPEALTSVFSRPAAAAIQAYALARRGDLNEARRVLGSFAGQGLPHTVAVLTARTWLALGDESSARATLNRSTRAVDGIELAAVELLFEEGVAGTNSRLIGRILSGSKHSGDLRRRVGLIVTYGLGRASPTISRLLFTSLEPLAAQIDPETLSALWVYAGLAGDEASEVFWRQRLDPKSSTTLPRLSTTGVNPTLFSVIAEKAPMPIEIVCTLLSAATVNSRNNPGDK